MIIKSGECVNTQVTLTSLTNASSWAIKAKSIRYTIHSTGVITLEIDPEHLLNARCSHEREDIINAGEGYEEMQLEEYSGCNSGSSNTPTSTPYRSGEWGPAEAPRGLMDMDPGAVPIAAGVPGCDGGNHLVRREPSDRSSSSPSKIPAPPAHTLQPLKYWEEKENDDNHHCSPRHIKSDDEERYLPVINPRMRNAITQKYPLQRTQGNRLRPDDEESQPNTTQNNMMIECKNLRKSDRPEYPSAGTPKTSTTAKEENVIRTVNAKEENGTRRSYKDKLHNKSNGIKDGCHPMVGDEEFWNTSTTLALNNISNGAEEDGPRRTAQQDLTTTARSSPAAPQAPATNIHTMKWRATVPAKRSRVATKILNGGTRTMNGGTSTPRTGVTRTTTLAPDNSGKCKLADNSTISSSSSSSSHRRNDDLGGGGLGAKIPLLPETRARSKPEGHEKAPKAPQPKEEAVLRSVSNGSRPVGKQCSIPGCTKWSVGKTKEGNPACTRHKGGIPCSVPDCTAKSNTRLLKHPDEFGPPGQRCFRHGGVMRCSIAQCPRASQGRVKTTDTYGPPGQRCARHGGGNRCNVAGCGKISQAAKVREADKYGPPGARCIKHGGGIKCSVEGCTNLSIGRIKSSGSPESSPNANLSSGPRCCRHGGCVRCGVEGCEGIAKRKAHVADIHGSPGPRCYRHFQKTEKTENT